MTQEQVTTIFQDALLTLLSTALPILLVGLVIGLTISIIQATTQVNEQTLVIVAKIVATMLALIFFGPLLLTNIMELFGRVFERVTTMGAW
jgi:flagellar biosynthetic protein FliQ